MVAQLFMKSELEALKWYKLAAETGYAGAQYDLGQLYANSNSTLKDYNKAAKWYKLAAEQGFKEAQGSLEEGERIGCY